MDNTKGGSSERWGLGLLVLFLDDDKSFKSNKKKKKKNPSLIITRAQSTISICALIVLFTVLLFTLSTSEPSTTSLSPTTHHQLQNSFPRRWLAQTPKTHLISNPPKNNNRPSSWLLKKKKNKWKLVTKNTHHQNSNQNFSFALQGMGALFRRGNRAMAEVLVAHLTENTTQGDFRWFLRTLHRSGITARADVVFIFPTSFHQFSTIIQQEDDSFTKLLLIHHIKNTSTPTPSIPLPSMITHFNPSHFKNSRSGESMWGYKCHSNSTGGEEKDELGGLSWGSVVGFEASELDPEGSLAGFIDPTPMQLRRWACYQMLLGRIRRNFKQVLLVDVNEIWVTGDIFSRVRTRSSEAVHLWTEPDEKSNKGRDFKDPKLSTTTASIVMGGIRSVRRLANAVLMETVRVATQRKSKTRIYDSAILTHLLRNGSLMEKVKIALQSTPFGINAIGSSSKSDFITRRGDSDGNLTALVVTEICSSSSSSSSSSVDWFVYIDC